MKSLIIIFLIHKFLDTAAAADSSNGDNSSGLKTTTKILIGVVAIIGIFVIGALIYWLRKAKPKKRKIRDIKPGNRDVKKQKPRSSTTSNTSKENIREPLMTSITPDVRLTVTTNPNLIQPSGTTTPSRVPPQTPLTPPQPQHSAIPSATQTTLSKVTESLEDSISYPIRKSTTEIIVTPEVTESHRSRPHTTIERDSPPQSRSSSDLSSRYSLPPTIQPHGPQSEVYPEGSTSIEGQLEQVTRSRDTSPYRQYHDYEAQTFDTPIDPRLQTQSRGLDTSLFSDTSILQSESADDSGEIGPGQRQRTYPAPQSPYDDSTIPSTPPERRDRPESVYSFDDNPGSTVPSPRPLQRSSPGSSQRSRRGRDRRGGNR